MTFSIAYVNPQLVSCQSLLVLPMIYSDLSPILSTFLFVPTLDPLLLLFLHGESSALAAISFWTFWSLLIYHCLRIFPGYLKLLGNLFTPITLSCF